MGIIFAYNNFKQGILYGENTDVKNIFSCRFQLNKSKYIQKHSQKHHLSLMLVVSNAEPSSGGRSERSRWTITALKDTGISPDFKEPAMTCPIDPKPTKPIDRDSTRRLLFSCPVDIARKDRGQVDHNKLRWTKRAASILNHSQN